MKENVSNSIDIAIESINYIIINYALSNMAVFFHSSILYVLFFASEIWVTTNYWHKALDKTKNKILSVFLIVSCYFIHIGMIYFIGYISGTLITFTQP